MRLKVLINSYGNDLFIVKIYRFTAVGHQVAPTDTCAIVSLERTFSLEETNLPTKTKVKKPCDILIIWWLFWSTSSQNRIRCRGGMAFKFYSRLILLQNKNVTYDVFFFAYLLNHNFQNTNIFLKLFDGEIRLQIKTVWD